MFIGEVPRIDPVDAFAFVSALHGELALMRQTTPELRCHVLGHTVGEGCAAVDRAGDGLQDLFERRVLHQVAGRTVGQHVVHAARVVVRGEGDDARVGGAPADLARGAGPATVRHAHIQEHHVGVTQGRDPDGFVGVLRGGDDREHLRVLDGIDQRPIGSSRRRRRSARGSV